MQFIYKPEGADPKTWEFKPTKMLSVEAEAIEDVTGWTYTEFGEKFMAGSTKAYHALLWVLLRRSTPGLKYDAVQFAMDEISIDYSDEEKRALVAAMREAGDSLDEEQRAHLEALLAEVDVPEPDPKEDQASPSDGGGGSGQ